MAAKQKGKNGAVPFIINNNIAFYPKQAGVG
jgi:hypothetical protein